ncbi:MAG: hypothetical protein ACRDBG_08345 [Waterburya sp.]
MPEWDNWAKPWTIEQCEYVYINSRFNLSRLASIAGIGSKKIANACKDLNWVEKRSTFAIELGKKVLQETGDVTAQQLLQNHKVLSEEMRAIAEEHYQASRAVRLKAQAFFEELDPKDKKVSPVSVNTWNNVLNNAIANERDAKGLKYWIDLNASIGKVLSEGFKINEN